MGVVGVEVLRCATLRNVAKPGRTGRVRDVCEMRARCVYVWGRGRDRGRGTVRVGKVGRVGKPYAFELVHHGLELGVLD